MPPANETHDAPSAPERIGRRDARYREVVARQFNKRFVGQPEYVQRATSTEDVVAAVQGAVREGRRVVATSGGHCLEGFVSDPDVQVIVDLSPMRGIAFDPARRAVVIEAGATVGDAFRALDERWNVVVPLGEYPGIGIGGHVAGGAFGFLCREHGLAVDHLEAVEVVTVDADGVARAVVAARDDPDARRRELWWAHTGGGAGNFGIVTRYWFRTPGASGADPSMLLPRAPTSVTTFHAEWSWDRIDRTRFLRLLQNHGAWCARHANASSPFLSLSLHRQSLGKIVLRGLSTAGDDAEARIRDAIASLADGIEAPIEPEFARMSWLEFALDPFPDLFGGAPPEGVRTKLKDAMLRRPLTDRQIGVAYHYLTCVDPEVAGGTLGLVTYGGRVNDVVAGATAAAQRDAILDVGCASGWVDPQADARNLAWVRAFYADLLADAGGVPARGEAYDGAFINHPDVDLADPALNTSGVAWHALYYGDGYPRLQRVKAEWDPRDVFRHALSIRPA